MNLHWLPNSLSLLRLGLGLIFPLLPESWRWSVVVVAAITDMADGETSRLLRAESALGKLLDPIADKVFLVGVVGTLLAEDRVTWVEVALIGLRDLMIVVGALWVIAARDGSAWRRMLPRLCGKAATVCQFAFLLTVLLDDAPWRSAILWLTAVVSGIAAVDYFVVFLRHRR